MVPVARAAARRRSIRRSRSPRRRSTGSSGRPLHAHRRLPRGDPPVAAPAQGAHVRADRRDRRGPDDLAAGGARRRPQLGLPVLLAPRRDAHAAGDAPCGLQRRGAWPGASGCSGRSPATRPTSRSCTASPASGGSRSASSTGCRASPDPRRCASGTPRRRSSSSTSTARRSTPSTRPASTARRPTTTSGRCMRKLLEWLEDGWRQPDAGIWEVRGPYRHFTHSKVMAWVAFDRGDPHARGVRSGGAGRPLAGAAGRDPGRGARARLEPDEAVVHPVLRLGRAGRERARDPARRVPPGGRRPRRLDRGGDPARALGRRAAAPLPLA